VLVRQRIAVFLDGCFWHGCPRHGTQSKTNARWWREKIRDNRERDRDSARRLRALGWTVLRIWEHEPIEQAAALIQRTATRRANASSRVSYRRPISR
jgi:DNA mismatch endonuclease (patch repair protein)